jgi:hypothetical protein
MEPTRIELKPFEGQRLHFTGTLEKYSDLVPCHKRKYYTACVQNIHCKKHDISFQHIWIRILPYQVKFAREGQRICFSGEVREYLRGYHKMQFTRQWEDISIDYGLADVRIVLPKRKIRHGKNDVKSRPKQEKRNQAPLVKPKWMK